MPEITRITTTAADAIREQERRRLEFEREVMERELYESRMVVDEAADLPSAEMIEGLRHYAQRINNWSEGRVARGIEGRDGSGDNESPSPVNSQVGVDLARSERRTQAARRREPRPRARTELTSSAAEAVGYLIRKEMKEEIIGIIEDMNPMRRETLIAKIEKL